MQVAKRMGNPIHSSSGTKNLHGIRQLKTISEACEGGGSYVLAPDVYVSGTWMCTTKST